MIGPSGQLLALLGKLLVEGVVRLRCGDRCLGVDSREEPPLEDLGDLVVLRRLHDRPALGEPRDDRARLFQRLAGVSLGRGDRLGQLVGLLAEGVPECGQGQDDDQLRVTGGELEEVLEEHRDGAGHAADVLVARGSELAQVLSDLVDDDHGGAITDRLGDHGLRRGCALLVREPKFLECLDTKLGPDLAPQRERP